jgi:hypothetical protein
MAATQAHVGRRVSSAKPPPEITIYMSRTEALALQKVAETGLRVVEALGLIQSTGATKNALDAVRAALLKQ